MPSALTIIASVAMKGWRPSLDDERAVDRAEHQREARRHQENRQDPEFRRNLRDSERGDGGAGRKAEKRRECDGRARGPARSRGAARPRRRGRAQGLGTRTAREKPTAKPMAIVAAGTPMIEAGVHPGLVRSIAQTIVEQPMTEPTDRSMPPSRMTMVIPVATRPVIETCRSTSVRFW